MLLKIYKTMKVTAISDIHGNLIDIQPCDLLIICGDVVGINDQRNMESSEHWWHHRFYQWVQKVPCDKVIIVPGNHDFYLEKLYKEDEWKLFKNNYRTITKDKVIFLLDEEYNYKGITIYGTPWIKPISYQVSRWAFETSQSEYYEQIPKCDILVTHDTPFHNDELYDNSSYRKCRYHFYGHWHEGESNKGIGRYNCSLLNDNYYLKFKPKVIDVMTPVNVCEVEQRIYRELLQEFNDLDKQDFDTIINFVKGKLETTQDKEDAIDWNGVPGWDEIADIISDTSLNEEIEKY